MAALSQGCTLAFGSSARCIRARLELALGGVEDGGELGREHDVALDLELAGHESLLGVDLAVGEALEGVVRHRDVDVGLLAGALRDGTLLLQVNDPGGLLALRVLDVELEDAVGLRC